MHESGAGSLIPLPQRAIRREMDEGEPKPLGVELLDPPDCVELRAADLEVVSAEGEPDHGLRSGTSATNKSHRPPALCMFELKMTIRPSGLGCGQTSE